VGEAGLAAEAPDRAPLEPSALRRLVFARELYSLARQLRKTGTRVSLSESLVVLDAAVEAALLATLAARNKVLGERASFKSAVDAAVVNFGFPVEKAANWTRLHEVRNAIQHSGIVPDETQTSELGTAALDCLFELVRKNLGIEFASLSIAELFEEPVVHELYKLAERLFAESQFNPAAVALVACFERARLIEQDRNFGSYITWTRFDARDESEGKSPHTHPPLADYVEKLHSEVEVLKLGVDYKSYRKFADVSNVLTPDFLENASPARDAKGEVEYWKKRMAPGPDIGAAWVAFALGFVRDAVLRWQVVDRKGFLEQLAQAFSRMDEKTKAGEGDRPAA
jgi:hypothetical protein